MTAALCRTLVLLLALSSLTARAQDAWSLQLSAEAGFSTRDIDLPRDGVTYQIRSGVHPALGVGFQLDHHAARRFSIGLAARYQSSIGLVLQEQLTGGTLHPRNTRSHIFEAGLAPRLRWDESGWAISGLLGYSIIELDPENHLLTPSYHLGGVHARISVQIPLGSQRVHLIVGPEAQLPLHMGDELRARGVAARGIGAGANAAFELTLNDHWLVAATYRELHFWLDTQQRESFSDGMRVVTAQLRGTL
jgi:hypothetical protein